MREGWLDASALAVAYCGTDAGASAVGPAARALRGSLPRARLILLWPASIRVPAAIALLMDQRIDYPTPSSPKHGKSSRAGRIGGAYAVAGLRKAGPTGVVVFTEAGHAPHLPAYLCCLAGVARRAALTSELGGGVLTNALAPPPPGVPAAERHLFLLDALGFGRRAEILHVPAVLTRTGAAVQGRAAPLG